MSRRLPIAVLAILFALTGAVTAAELKKWVDSEGRVHYSDTAPPVGAKQEELNVRNAPGKTGGTPPKTYQEKELEFRKRRIEEAEQAKKDQEAAAKAGTEQENCRQAKNRLQSIEESGRVYTYDAKGERQYMDDSTREREMDRARKAIKDWCK